jgi:hypothetical protein
VRLAGPARRRAAKCTTRLVAEFHEAGIAPETRDEGPTGGARWGFLSVDDVHEHHERRLRAETRDRARHQPLSLQVFVNHMQWHVTPAETGPKKRMLGSQVGPAPGHP